MSIRFAAPDRGLSEAWQADQFRMLNRHGPNH